MKVMKFGGTCMSNNEMMTKVEDVIAREKEEKVILVSAVAGVTDNISGFIESFHSDEEIENYVKELKKLHLKLLPPDEDLTKEATTALDQRFNKLETLLYGVSYTEEITPRTRDLIISMGERLSSIVLATRLRARGLNSSFFNSDELGIITDGVHGNATADLKECERSVGPKIFALSKAGVIPVVTGFFGISPGGHVTTFGRGGTDYSASVLGFACSASVIEIWKDVDGFMTADPKMATDAKQVDKLSYEEAAELAYFGAKVLHPRTVFPAMEKDIPIAVRNVLKPDSAGSMIFKNSTKRKNILKSVSYLRNIATIKVFGTGAGYKTGFLRDISEAMSEADINIYSATTSQTCVAMLIEKSDVKKAQDILEKMLGGYYERLEVTENIALICTVGSGLASTRGIAARVFKVVAANDVNVDLISAGASTVAYHFTIDKKDLQKTIRAIHDEFFPKKS
ncbi:MAG TPA: aspartate kinase [Euryarchaeota archaeon]|nr:aspartate kinase [Euryarchaeota archaeon]